ncbi:MAG: serine hydroxymethyltransferase [Fimbriimonadaceae bacterium]|nr:serine hydroxymethyltransferase [Fimbriimonadaceae bacterium]
MSALMKALFETDPASAAILAAETQRQRETLVLIASENYASPAILAAQGSLFCNKYAEGYPSRRYYNGCQQEDAIEQLAIDRAKELFGCEHVNAQPHAGAQANTAVYQAVLQPGDTILSLELAHGGHLSHGMKLNISGQLYQIVHYGVDRASGRIVMDQVAELAAAHRPKLIVFGASAYPRHFEVERFRAIADSVGALLMADMAHVMGLIAGRAHPDPVPFCDLVTFTTHKTMRGPRGGMILCREALAKDIDRAVFPGQQGGPFMHNIMAKAVMLAEAASPAFRQYAADVVTNAAAMAATLQARGYALCSGGTDNHLLLVDLRPQEITGRDAANALEAAGICVNKNGVPFDERSPMVTSGIRLGSPAITTRGFNVDAATLVANLVADVLDNLDSPTVRDRVRGTVAELCAAHPLYDGYLPA